MKLIDFRGLFDFVLPENFPREFRILSCTPAGEKYGLGKSRDFPGLRSINLVAPDGTRHWFHSPEPDATASQEEIEKRRRNLEIVERFAAGATIEQVARATGLHERHIKALRHQLADIGNDVLQMHKDPAEGFFLRHKDGSTFLGRVEQARLKVLLELFKNFPAKWWENISRPK